MQRVCVSGTRGASLRERATENHRTSVIRTRYVTDSVDAEEKTCRIR